MVSIYSMVQCFRLGGCNSNGPDPLYTTSPNKVVWEEFVKSANHSVLHDSLRHPVGGRSQRCTSGVIYAGMFQTHA
jgi:hypothetical protein